MSMDQKAPSSATLAHAALLLLHHGVNIKRDRTADWHNPAAAATNYRLAFDGDIHEFRAGEIDGLHMHSVLDAVRNVGRTRRVQKLTARAMAFHFLIFHVYLPNSKTGP